MLRPFALACFAIACASPCFGQGLCYAAPRATSLNVPLVANSMEPSFEPQLIRVPDRTQVTLNIVNVSPTEYCSPTAPAPTPTTVTNPIESIINTVSGLKSFNLIPESTFKAQIRDIPDLMEPDTSQRLTEAEKNAPKDHNVTRGGSGALREAVCALLDAAGLNEPVQILSSLARPPSGGNAVTGLISSPR